jgi:MFS family permease
MADGRRADLPDPDALVSSEGAGSALEPSAGPGAIVRSLPAFGFRDFRIFWAGQLVSLTGTWIQSVAQQWLVLKLTHSAFDLGLVTTIQFTPMLALSLIGGAVSDRLPKRNLLILTQIGSGSLALLLGVLVQTNAVRYWHVLLIAAALGTINVLYVPARQAFVPELVSRETLYNAVALNSTLFNAARVAGPAIGGILIASIGLTLNFYLNAASYLAVIAGLLLIPSRSARPRAEDTNLFHEVAEGLSYIRSTPIVLAILSLVGVASLFALNFTTLMPVMAQDVLHVGSSGFGFLMASMGVGSLAGALLLSFIRRHDLSRQLIYTGAAVFTIAEVLFALSRSFALSVPLLILVGLASTVFSITANTRVLSLTPPHLQGRVMSVYSLMFLGMTPFGSLLAGAVAERWGAPAALVSGASITLVFTVLLFLYRSRRQPLLAPQDA